MDDSLTVSELLRTAMAHGAVSFKLRSGLHPIICSKKGVQTYDTQPSTADEIETLLRGLTSSRQMRQLREAGFIYFRSSFEDIRFLGVAIMEGDEIGVELRKLAA